MYGGATAGAEIVQTVKAQTAARRIATERIRGQLGRDSLHGASLTTTQRELGEGDADHRVHPPGQPGPPVQGLRPHARPPTHGAPAVTGPEPARRRQGRRSTLEADMRAAAEAAGPAGRRPRRPG